MLLLQSICPLYYPFRSIKLDFNTQPLTLHVGLHVSQSVHVADDKYDDMAYLLTWHRKNDFFFIMPRHHICQVPRIHFG